MNTNYFSLIYGIEAALPLLRKSPCGHIIGMSSVAGFHGLPHGEAYCASKAAVMAFLQGLSVDLQPENIKVSIVCPGFIDTPLTRKHHFKMPFLMDDLRAAKVIVKGILKQKAEISFPKKIAIPLKLLHFLPQSWQSFFLRKVKNKAEAH
jgi:short-subunit dehydrogenase